MLASESAPASSLRNDCISCGQTCQHERSARLPDRLYDNLRLTLLSTWSKVEPNRRRDYPMAAVSTPLPKSIDFTQFEAPYTEIVETCGFVPLATTSISHIHKKMRIEQQLTQSIAPKPCLSQEYEACMNGTHYYDVDSGDDGYADECFYENAFREMEVGEKRCFSFEIQCNIMDAAYFISDFSKLERAEKRGSAAPVKHTEIWEAERIVKHVKKPKEGKTLFLVEWAGRQSNGKPWPKTWEPAENLGPVLLHLYERETGLSFTCDE